jgi:hypothetical protein
MRIGLGSIDESDELFRSVTSVHVEGEEVAILAIERGKGSDGITP